VRVVPYIGSLDSSLGVTMATIALPHVERPAHLILWLVRAGLMPGSCSSYVWSWCSSRRRRNVVVAPSALALAGASISGAAISSSEGSAEISDSAFRLCDARDAPTKRPAPWRVKRQPVARIPDAT
jgi:hypothetical protein